MSLMYDDDDGDEDKDNDCELRRSDDNDENNDNLQTETHKSNIVIGQNALAFWHNKITSRMSLASTLI